jgi:pilus assembly protein CpaB
MGRRAILLIVAVLIAAFGAGMVYVYAHSADQRATDKTKQVQVLKAVSQITAGESLASAQSAGKLQLGTVTSADLVPGAISAVGTKGNDVALATVFPGEQILASNFGTAGDQSNLQIPAGDLAISVSLTDTGRVAGFVSPGNNVAIFVNVSGGNGAQDSTQVLLPKVQVIAIGATTVLTKTTTDTTGSQTTEQLPNTLFTLAVNQSEAEKIMFASTHGQLNFALLNAKSKIATGQPVTNANLFR